MTKSDIVCANVNNFNQRWVLRPTSNLVEPHTVNQMLFDWVAENWYFLDLDREIIYVCNKNLSWCRIVVENNLGSPRGMALDPLRGFLFFTRYGVSPPALERCLLDGTSRKIIVEYKILYPYRITLDLPNQRLYWVDHYLDFVEKADYDGEHRSTVLKLNNTFSMYNKMSDGITFFENKLLLSSEMNNSILEFDTMTKNHRVILQNVRQPNHIVVFHRQAQPDPEGEFPQTIQISTVLFEIK